MYFKSSVALIVFYCLCNSLIAQKNETSVFDPHELFAQNFFTKNGNEFRSANGAPGPKYWQNRADYTLHASIDTLENVLIVQKRFIIVITVLIICLPYGST